MAGKVQLIGMKDLQDNLGRFPADIERGALVRGIKAGANLILQEAKSRVPVLTGALKRGLKIKMLTKKGVAALIGADKQSGGPHAHLVEFGTQPHMITSGTKTVLHPGARPHPFLFPSLEAKRSEAIEAVRREVQSEIDKRK